MVKKELLGMLRCPHCMQQEPNDGLGEFELYENVWLICEDCGRKYPIIEDIPVLLLDETEKWKDKEKGELPIPPTKDD